MRSTYYPKFSRLWAAAIIAVVIAFTGCEKKSPDYVGPYAANIGKTRLWSGRQHIRNYPDTATILRPILDTSLPVVVNGNDIIFCGDRLSFFEKNEAIKVMIFSNGKVNPGEPVIDMYYYYEEDYMVYAKYYTYHTWHSGTVWDNYIELSDYYQIYLLAVPLQCKLRQYSIG